MADNLTKKGIQDDIRINSHEDFEVRDWATKFGVSPGSIINAVAAVGPLVKNVRQWLHTNGYIIADE